MDKAQFAHKKLPPTAPVRRGSRSRASSVPAAQARAPAPAALTDEPAPPPPERRPSLPPIASPQAVVPPAPIPSSEDQPWRVGGRRRSKPTVESLRPPKPFVPPSAGKKLRPSLSEQLAACRDQSAAVLSELQQTFGVDAGGARAGPARPLCQVHPRSLRVGSKTCDWPGVLKLYDDRAEYHFTHPVHRKVHMVMRYRDMSQLAFRSGSLRFRIEHALEYFIDEYNPFDPSHHLAIALASGADVVAVQQSHAWARMQSQCISRS
mmetsp:Transcript_10513/g.31277  ORF Transcript_10513/g.31277 Transcript_10513/m.31277 type:complete len:264 (+) Transcript_10513:84-875(+)